MSLVVYQQRLKYFLRTLVSMMKERAQLSLLLFLERISEGASTRVFAAASSDRCVGRSSYRKHGML
jgi:hypothetical protein